MKIAVVSPRGVGGNLSDRSEAIRLTNQPESDEVVFADQFVPGLTAINTCNGAITLMTNKEARKSAWEVLKFSSEPIKTNLFSVFNGKTFGDWLEVQYYDRLMNDDVGPNVGFARGLGITTNVPITEAVPQVAKLVELLKEIQYRGEVQLHVDESFSATGFTLGHNPSIFGLYQEISKTSLDDTIAFCAGLKEDHKLYDSMVMGVLVSAAPFPMAFPTQKIKAPHNAEKHIWRLMASRSQEVCLVTCWGGYAYEAKKRVFATIKNMVQYDPFLQFRTDLGNWPKYLFANYTWMKDFKKPEVKDGKEEGLQEGQS